MMTENKKINNDSMINGAVSLTISVIIVKIIGFIYKVPLSYILGDVGMGYFNSAYSIFTFFYVLSSGGIPRAVSITVAEGITRKNTEYAKKILFLCLKIFFTIGILFSVSLMIFSDFFAGVIGNSLSSFSLFCIAPALSFVSASGVLKGYLSGITKFKYIAIAEVIEGLIKFIVGLTMALYAKRCGYDVHIISAYTILGVTMGALLGAIFLYVCSKTPKTDEILKQKTNVEFDSIDVLKKVCSISIPITISSSMIGISNIIDLGIIIKRLEAIGFSSDAAMGLYGNFTTLAIPMLNLAIAFITPISTSAIPDLTKYRTLKSNSAYCTTVESLFCVAAIISFPIAIAYMLFSKEILILLFEDSSALIAAPLLTVLSFSVILLTFLTMINTVLESLMHPRLPLISMGIGAVFKLVFAYVLVGKFGIIGAPISTVVSHFVSICISIVFLSKKAKYTLSSFKVLFYPFVCSAFSILVAFVLYKSFVNEQYDSIKFFAFSLISAFLYILFTLLILQKRVNFLFKYVKMAKKTKYSLLNRTKKRKK